MVTTRSKSVKRADRKQKVWNAIRIVDSIMVTAKNIIENDEQQFNINELDLPEFSLFMTALPLPPDERKQLINNAVFTV